MEILAQRRTQVVEKKKICSAGSVLVGEMCQPVRQNSATGQTPNTAKKPRTQTPALNPNIDVAGTEQPKFEVWSDAYVDYEKRTGLTSGNATETRAQTTSGALFGADRRFSQDGYDIAVGFFGGASQTNQSFTSSASELQNTLYTHSQLEFNGASFVNETYTYILPANHLLTADADQNIRSPILGLTFSASRAGFFTDGVLRAEIGDLNRIASTGDNFPQTLNANFENQSQTNPSPTQNGCISSGVNPNTHYAYPAPYYMLTNNQTLQNNLALQTSAINLIYAQDVGYHFDLPRGFWLEPLVGAQFTYSFYGSNAVALGLEDGYALRIQGGARIRKHKSWSRRILMDHFVYWTALQRRFD